jgi:UrcA family protein
MKSLVPAVLLAACQLAGVAVADDLSGEPRKQVVRYADLDLTHAAGAAVLLGRIQAAAREVCEPLRPQWMVSRQCMDQALARAVADVNAPMLTDYYIARTGRSLSTVVSAARGQRTAAVDGGAP